VWNGKLWKHLFTFTFNRGWWNPIRIEFIIWWGSIAGSYGMYDRGLESWQGLWISLLTTVSRQALGHTQPPIKWVLGALSLWVKQQGREVDHSPPCTAEVKNAWSCISTLKYVFMAWCSVKAQGQLYLYIYKTTGLFLASCWTLRKWRYFRVMGCTLAGLSVR